MGTDKALLPFRGRTLVECVAQHVKEAAGSVTLLGPREKYQFLGFPVIEDLYPDKGPLGGIASALSRQEAEWNLIVACDMPNVTARWLSTVLERAEAGTAGAVIPVGPSTIPDPLCAAYHRACLPHALKALGSGRLKITDALSDLAIDWMPVDDPDILINTNTPQEWNAIPGAANLRD